MPTYTFLNLNTSETFTEIMSISDKEKYLAENPHIQQQLIKPLSLGDPVRLGRIKPDDGFRDRLKEIKKAHPLGKAINII
jgi:hypothetical protein